jgi:hypothetical protein
LKRRSHEAPTLFRAPFAPRQTRKPELIVPLPIASLLIHGKTAKGRRGPYYRICCPVQANFRANFLEAPCLGIRTVPHSPRLVWVPLREGRGLSLLAELPHLALTRLLDRRPLPPRRPRAVVSIISCSRVGALPTHGKMPGELRLTLTLLPPHPYNAQNGRKSAQKNSDERILIPSPFPKAPRRGLRSAGWFSWFLGSKLRFDLRL